MKYPFIQSVFTGMILANCAGNSNTTNNTSTPSTTDSTEIGKDTVLDFTLKTLPGSEAIALTNETYIIKEMLAFIESEYNPGQNLSVVISEDHNLYLEIGYDKTGKEESWNLGIAVENPFGFEVELEFTDANHDAVKDELVIWWSQSDGNNGIMSGYESSGSGVIIFDVMQRTAMVNFLYSHHYSSYTAGDKANTNDPEFHAKMDENSEWSICSFSHNVKLVKGELVLSDFSRENEGMGECSTPEYAAGIYRYNYTSGLFELVQ